MPYTVFYARKNYVKNNKDIIDGFTNAIDDGLKYTNSHSSRQIAMLISRQFPDLSINDLEMMIENYKNADTWLDSTCISRKSFKNLEHLLIKNKLIKKEISYKKIIKNICNE